MAEPDPLAPLRVALRTPRGLLLLFLATLVVAAALAGVAASQRDFFASKRQWKVPAPSGRVVAVAARLRSGELPPDQLPEQPADVRAGLARHPLVQDPTYGDRSWLVPLLWEQLPEETVATVERALLAGSPAQQDAAIALAAASDGPAAREALETALATARARRDADLEQRLTRAIAVRDPDIVPPSEGAPSIFNDERGGTP